MPNRIEESPLAIGKKKIPYYLLEGHSADHKTRILFIDSNDFEFATYRRQMKNCGIWDVSSISNREDIEKQISETSFNIIAIEVPSPLHRKDSLNLLSRLRAAGYSGIIAMLADSATMDLVYQCARLGASEFLLKTRHLDIGKEVARILARRPPLDRSCWHPKSNLGYGVFTSAGLTACELEIVSEFAKGFQKHSEIAKRLEKSEPHIRKNFSRIYNKLSHGITIENSAQLAHLITICSIYT